MKTYALRIKSLRENRAMSQDDLAKAIGAKSRSTISMYESGNRVPDFETFRAIAEVFDAPLSYVMGTDDESPDSDDLMALREQLRRQPGLRILFDAGKNATEDDLMEVARMLEKFKKLRDGEE